MNKSTLVTIAAVLMAVVMSAALVSQTTSAAFTGSTKTNVNSWRTGHVTISDTRNGVAMFTVKNVKPGDSGEQCILIRNTSRVANRMQMYVRNFQEGKGSTVGLGSVVNMTIQGGSGVDTSNSCATFRSSGNYFVGKADTLGKTRNTYANGMGNLSTDGRSDTSSSVRISWSIPETVGNEMENGSMSMEYVWEARSL